MPNPKKTSLWSYVAVVAICGFVYWCSQILCPDCPSRPAARAAHCQSSMNSLGKALKSYMTDWDDHFPTNRSWNGKLTADVELTPENPKDEIFRYGPNWVEGLYIYNEKVAEPGANSSVWKCPNARPDQQGGQNACVSYAINMNLLEQHEGVIKDAGHTMLIREMDRMYNAVCRPVNISKDENSRPIGAFLTNYDPKLAKGTKINCKLHGAGSNILLADGHVKNMPASYMPADNKLYWDKATKQWWNSKKDFKKIVAITP